MYVRNKEKAALEVGMNARTVRLPASVSQNELEDVIAGLNAERDVDGILLQLPLPRGLDADACISRISPEKDVDGLTPTIRDCLHSVVPPSALYSGRRHASAGSLRHFHQRKKSRGCRPQQSGRASSCSAARIKGAGCHSDHVSFRTANLAEECRSADILCTALGNPRFIGADMVKPGAVVIDVGINRIEEGGKARLCGDVDFAAVAEKCSAITPVPGGVGPMTIAMLLSNTVQAWKSRLAL